MFNNLLYVITNRYQAKADLATVVEEALQGGADIIQLREKDLSAQEQYLLAKRLKELTVKYGKKLFINDRVDVALAVGADGVHLGQNSLSPKYAKALGGDNFLTGVSVHSLEEAKKALLEGADYLLVSHIFPTDCKPGLEPKGIQLLRQVRQFSQVPIIALGGINRKNAAEVMEIGCNGAAVMSAVMATSDPRTASADLKNILKKF